MDDTRKTLIARAEHISHNLRLCNSGVDIHEVCHMRMLADLVVELAKDMNIPENEVLSTLRRLEGRQLDYFRKKFLEIK